MAQKTGIRYPGVIFLLLGEYLSECQREPEVINLPISSTLYFLDLVGKELPLILASKNPKGHVKEKRLEPVTPVYRYCNLYFQMSFQKLCERWQKCIVAQWDYFEGGCASVRLTIQTTRGLLATDHVILNHGQVTWTTPELAPPLLTTTPHQREDISALDRFNVHRCPTRRVFSGTGLEPVTKQATVRYLYHSATAATVGQVKKGW
ncbi:uncharacterized protein TNCV_1736881 [Trichonephila clavipes]|nr:uncharacterized protein TNCV_1736881 [Trichonephila clavipes]